MLKVDKYFKIPIMKKVKKCLRCESIRKAKSGFNRGKRIFICKNCAFNYTGTKSPATPAAIPQT